MTTGSKLDSGGSRTSPGIIVGVFLGTIIGAILVAFTDNYIVVAGSMLLGAVFGATVLKYLFPKNIGYRKEQL